MTRKKGTLVMRVPFYIRNIIGYFFSNNAKAIALKTNNLAIFKNVIPATPSSIKGAGIDPIILAMIPRIKDNPAITKADIANFLIQHLLFA